MNSFFLYVLCFGLGASVIFIGVKRRPTLQQREKVTKLQTANTDLQNKNGNLIEIIHQIQQDIKNNQQEIRELKEAVATLSGQVVLSLEILSSVTNFREQVNDIDAEIIITKRFQKKYSQFLTD